MSGGRIAACGTRNLAVWESDIVGEHIIDFVLDGKRILITGGTGSLGKALLRRLLAGTNGSPSKVTVLSRDEAKQHEISSYLHRRRPTDEVIYRNCADLLEFRIGDVRDFHSVGAALRDVDVVFNAAALKQVPTCEYFPHEAVRTNIDGAENIVHAIRELACPSRLWLAYRPTRR